MLKVWVKNVQTMCGDSIKTCETVYTASGFLLINYVFMLKTRLVFTSLYKRFIQPFPSNFSYKKPLLFSKLFTESTAPIITRAG